MDERFPDGIDKVLLVDEWLRSGKDCLQSATDKVPLVNERFCRAAKQREGRRRNLSAT